MVNKKSKLPKFENEEQEAEYWDKNSPLDVIENPEAQKVKTTRLKDRPIAIRLDSENRIKLEEAAKKRGLGPSTFTRIVLMSALQNDGKEVGIECAEKLPDKFESEVKSCTLSARTKIEEALGRALESDWKTALLLTKEAEVITPIEYVHEIKIATRMVWLCIQRSYIGPLIDDSEKAISDWDYNKAKTMLDDILLVLKTAQLPLDFKDYSLRITNIASAACGAAYKWKNDIDFKLERTVVGVSNIKANIEELLRKETEQMSSRTF
jgi:hypothetical protein